MAGGSPRSCDQAAARKPTAKTGFKSGAMNAPTQGTTSIETRIT